MANSVDPDQTPRSAASDLGLNCLLRSVCPNTLSKYGNFFSNRTPSVIINLPSKSAVRQTDCARHGSFGLTGP